MATLWQIESDNTWTQSELHDGPVLIGDTITPVSTGSLHEHRSSVLLFPSETDAGSALWSLLAPPEAGVRLNNSPLENGMRLISDRDSIRVPGQSMLFFSAERLARIEAFPGTADIYCARCKLLLSKGDPAVRCPQCGVWHHECADNDRNCWTYTNTCSLCDQSTGLDCAEYRWTPGSL